MNPTLSQFVAIIQSRISGMYMFMVMVATISFNMIVVNGKIKICHWH